jgi:putative SOS response-associated peptidase YedK
MCGRMSLTRRELTELADELGSIFDPTAAPSVVWRPRYNVAPTDPHPVMRADGGRKVAMGHWGFRGGPKQALLINARSETIRARPAFRDAFARRRCVVPADGFYEWRKTEGAAGGAARRPLWFHRPDGQLLLFAGLWEPPAPILTEADAQARGRGLPRFVVLTTTPNALLAEVHDRMPAIFTTLEEAAAWLAAPSLELLRPAPEGFLAARPVSARVNSVRNDDPACLEPEPEPSGASGPARQLSLFG